jgi:hypothetical protein
MEKSTVVRVCPGKDGHVRIVEMHTSNGQYLRPTRKVKLFRNNERREVQNE